MLKVGITGQSGFIGTHLYNYFSTKRSELILIPFQDNLFLDRERLEDWTAECDVIIHLAAINRHENETMLYETNIKLVKLLVGALENTKRKPHVIFSSSSQESRDNIYGKSKKEGRKLLLKWAEQNGARFTGLIIPNVFGPFGVPYYNSVVATFCHQLTHSEMPGIDVDNFIKLIYVGELAEEIFNIIIEGKAGHEYYVTHTSEKKVSEILLLLERFKRKYFDDGIIPQLNNRFELNLFNTFRTYYDFQKKYPVLIQKKIDDRGFFSEMARLEIGGQLSFSSTNIGITRGNHYHTRKIERFIVIKGEALIQLRQIGKSEVMNFYLSGENPSYVDMPVWFTHNITNIGNGELITIFWINEFYNEKDPDTYFEMVDSVTYH